MILMIDNYDSFTYNIVQYLGELGEEVETRRNDEIDCGDIEAMKPEVIMISPGPCTPDKAGISLEVVTRFGAETPILGVCLGHQCIVEAYGGSVNKARRVMHGKTSAIHHKGKGLFEGIESPFTATRYHSLVAGDVPDCLEVTAWSEDEADNPREVMGVRHRSLPVEGVQFHPESILTEHGHTLLGTFLRQAREQ